MQKTGADDAHSAPLNGFRLPRSVGPPHQNRIQGANLLKQKLPIPNYKLDSVNDCCPGLLCNHCRYALKMLSLRYMSKREYHALCEGLNILEKQVLHTITE